MSDNPNAPDNDPHLINAEDPDVVIKPYVEDVISFVVFWGLAGVVFLQFFTRYVLNDSMAWTEEIARYLLIWVTFIGSAITIRRGTNIVVEVVQQFLPEMPARILRFGVDVVTVGFVGLLCWFAFLVMQRMQIQTMMVIEVPMSVVYGGVVLGCVLMFYRSIRVLIANARRLWAVDPEKAQLIID